ncbi:MAG: hypothetical protein MAG471_01174 [Acidimicrobiaceae bacterium]|nr:hypothetical protein [Acidimicrobiaceae bacterium]
MLLLGPVEREAGVVLLGYVRGLLDPYPADHVTLYVETQNGRGVGSDIVDGGCELHASGLAPPTGVDLGLDHDRGAEPLGCGHRLVDAERDLSR